MGSNNITTTGKILFSNVYSAEGDLPSASTYHGMFAHVHATGAAYFAHGGAWIRLANNTDVPAEYTSFNSDFDNRLATKSTTNLAEGTNLYYTYARADSIADARIGASSIGALSDVDTSGITSGQVLKWDGSSFVAGDDNSGGGGGATVLGDLTDVSSSAPSTGQVLKWSGSEWAPAADATGGGGGGSATGEYFKINYNLSLIHI